MKQEDKELLLKDLCSRLPYEVKVNYNGSVCTIQSISPDGDVLLEDEGGIVFPNVEDSLFVDIEEVKPYLRPMSSMTFEQECKYREVIASTLNHYEVYDWLNKNHFDYRGLIPKDLAIDATNLNIY